MNELGLSISSNRVLSLSTVMGNSVCRQYETDKVVCCPSLKKNMFTTSALDNIDHNPSSTTEQGSLHGMGISLFQHPTSSEPGVKRENSCIDLFSTKMLRLFLEVYTNVRPVNKFNKEQDISSYAEVNMEPSPSVNSELEKENRYELIFISQTMFPVI